MVRAECVCSVCVCVFEWQFQDTCALCNVSCRAKQQQQYLFWMYYCQYGILLRSLKHWDSSDSLSYYTITRCSNAYELATFSLQLCRRNTYTSPLGHYPEYIYQSMRSPPPDDRHSNSINFHRSCTMNSTAAAYTKLPIDSRLYTVMLVTFTETRICSKLSTQKNFALILQCVHWNCHTVTLSNKHTKWMTHLFIHKTYN